MTGATVTGGGGSLTLATLPSTGYPMDTFTVPEGEDPSFYLPIPHGPLGVLTTEIEYARRVCWT